MKKLVTLIIILIITFSCKNDDDSSNTSKTKIDLITGINFIDEVGQPIESYGNPNVFVDEQIHFYPNPVQDILNINSDNEITDYWIITGDEQKIFQNTSFSTILNGDSYSVSQLDNIAVQQSQNGINATDIQINMTNLNEGYFKVFVKINNQIYWNNIYHSFDQQSIDSVINFWN